MHVCMYACTCMYMHVHVHVYIYIYIHVCTYIYIYIYTHTRTEMVFTVLFSVSRGSGFKASSLLGCGSSFREVFLISSKK